MAGSRTALRLARGLRTQLWLELRLWVVRHTAAGRQGPPQGGGCVSKSLGSQGQPTEAGGGVGQKTSYPIPNTHSLTGLPTYQVFMKHLKCV